MEAIMEIYAKDPSTWTPEEQAIINMYLPRPTGDPAVRTTVLIAAWTMFGVSTLFLALRIYCRRSKGKSLWWDDYLLVVGWAFLCCATALQSAIQGEGYLVTTIGDDWINPRNYASDSIMKLALAFIKTSFSLTVLRIVVGWPRYLVWGCMIVMNITCVVHAVLVWRNNCGVPDRHTFQPCWDMNSGIYMNMIGAIISAVTDFILAGVPVHVIWGLQMKRIEKIGVGVAMSIGILAGVVSIVRASESKQVVNITGPAFGYRLMKLTIWIQAEPNAAIIASSIPVLRILFRDAVRTRYYGASGEKGTYLKSTNTSHFHGGTNTNITAAKPDDDSERSILNDDTKPKAAGIQRTQQITVEYDNHDPSQDTWDQGHGIEMGNFSRPTYKGDNKN